MHDREKVICHLNDCMEASRQGNTWVFVRKDIVEDAIALLKEHDAERLEIAHEIVSGSILMYQGKELVRCKDCDNKECWGRAGDVVCGIDGMPHRPDWFCAYGIAKDTDVPNK